MLVNLEKYKTAKAKGDEKAVAKFTKIAGQLSPKKKAATESANKAYQEYEDKISGLHANAELELEEQDLRTEIRSIILTYLNESDIDMGNVFMKGVGPGGESNPDKLTDEPVEDVLDDFEKEIKRVELEAPESEAIGLTLAGVALSLPEIIKLIGKLVNLLKKIPFLKKLSGDKLIAIGDKYHQKITGAFEFIIKKAGVKDTTKAKKFANVLHHIVIAMLLVAGGITQAGLYSSGSMKGATLKGALNAIKAKEIRAFLITSADAII